MLAACCLYAGWLAGCWLDVGWVLSGCWLVKWMMPGKWLDVGWMLSRCWLAGWMLAGCGLYVDWGWRLRVQSVFCLVSNCLIEPIDVITRNWIVRFRWLRNQEWSEFLAHSFPDVEKQFKQNYFIDYRFRRSYSFPVVFDGFPYWGLLLDETIQTISYDIMTCFFRQHLFRDVAHFHHFFDVLVNAQLMKSVSRATDRKPASKMAWALYSYFLKRRYHSKQISSIIDPNHVFVFDKFLRALTTFLMDKHVEN